MNRIDRYVAKQFIKTALFSLLAFSLLFILIDMVENLDDFMDENVPTHIIALYYVYFLPQIMGLMVPVAMLLSALFVVGRMSNSNEMTVIKCSGMSLRRFMFVFVFFGLAVSSGMLYFDGWIVPRINTLRVRLAQDYLKKDITQKNQYNMFFQDSNGRIVTLDYYDESTSIAREVSIQRFNSGDPTIMEHRLDARSMRWDAVHEEWVLFDVHERTFTNGFTDNVAHRENVAYHDSLRIGKLVISPSIIVKMQQKPEEMELMEFRDYIDRQKLAGSDIARLLVDFHGKIAFPFSSLIVVFFAVPFASVKRRSGLSVQFGISILICFTYLVTQKLSQVFGYNGNIPPLLAAWLPNIVFFLSGFVVITKVQK
jgi:lipopolysaccharide export system permease protein